MYQKRPNLYEVILMDRTFNVIAVIEIKAEDDAEAHIRGQELCWDRKASEYRVQDAKPAR